MKELAVEAFRNNTAFDLLKRLKDQNCAKRVLLVPEPLYHKSHYSFCKLDQQVELGEIRQLVDDTFESMCNDLGAVYLRQSPHTISEDGFTTRAEYLSQRHLFHISDLACPLILEDIRFNLGMVSKSEPVEL